MPDEKLPPPVRAAFEKQKRTSINSKPKLAALYREMTAKIENNELTDGANFDKKFFVYCQPDRQRVLVREVSPGTVSPSSKEELAIEILNYNNDYQPGSDLWTFTTKQALDCAEYFRLTARPLAEPPKLIASKSEDGLAFYRLPFDLEPGPGDTPFFDAFCSRASDPAALRAYLGSLFSLTSPNQQYLYLYGSGQDGKGSLARNLQWVFGPAFQSKFVPDRNSSRFWVESLISARVCVIPESDSLGFCGGSFFKTLTGGDAVSVEPKGKPAYTVNLNCKFIVTSNTVPTIEDSTANRRRMIYIELKPLDSASILPDGVVAEALRAEAPRFYARCLAEYEASFKDAMIVADSSVFDNRVGSAYDEDFDVIVEKYFRIVRGGRLGVRKMREVKLAEKMDRYAFSRFLAYLERRFGVLKTRDESSRFYTGIELASGDVSLQNIPF